jgi:hypothetical protein
VEVPLRLATLLAAQLFDVGTFIVMIRAEGPAAEANPVAAGLLESHGLAILVLLKFAIVVLVGALAVAGVARNGARGAWAFVAWAPLGLAITFGMIGGITNAATILY